MNLEEIKELCSESVRTGRPIEFCDDFKTWDTLSTAYLLWACAKEKFRIAPPSPEPKRYWNCAEDVAPLILKAVFRIKNGGDNDFSVILGVYPYGIIAGGITYGFNMLHNY